MSRMLLAPFPLHGHVFPMAALAAELGSRGHDVTVAISPPFAEQFRKSGCEVTEVEIEPRAGIPKPPVGRGVVASARAAREDRHRVAEERAKLTARLAGEIGRVRPDVVVADAMAPWGADAARATGTRSAALYVTYALNEEVILADMARRLAPRTVRLLRRSRLLRRHPAVRDPAARSELVLVNSVPELQPQHGSFDDRYHFVGPLRPAVADRVDTDRDGPNRLPWEHIEKGPTLYVSTGTFSTRGAEFFRAVAQAFAGTEWCVVLATSHTDPGELGELPENVTARRHVPQGAVLEHADVFLTHAGMNSALEGLVLGVPMAFVPSFWDQRTIARRLVELGAGIVVDPSASAVELREAITGLAADADVRATLAELSGRTARHDGPVRAVRVLEKFAAWGSVGRG
ncbi:nucleotide disphospho-sugar-binding domain-containing protein [Streptomyces sp. NPDC058751]|uniref:nucleotide disphospho-sugar-binding domain-containing protein n=1 Tax=Streptomyces sp. NPDC058751 TaxID=3346623 RepID=UPI00369889B8